MQADQRVYWKSDKAGRALALTFCLAPVVIPALTIASVILAREWPEAELALPTALTSSAHAAAPLTTLSQTISLGGLPAREGFVTSFFADPLQPAQRFEALDANRLVQSAKSDEGDLLQMDLTLRPSQ